MHSRKEGEQIIAAPTLIKMLPLLLPLRRFIGGTAQTERILLGLDLRQSKRPNPSSANQPRHMNVSNNVRETQLREENDELRARLDEALQALRAIGSGSVDSQVVQTGEGPQDFSLNSAEAASNRLRGDILSQVSDAVGMIDSEQRITYLNPAFERLYGVKAADELGRRTSLYERRWPTPEDEAAALATLQEHGQARWELIHVTRDGRALNVQCTVCLMLDATGKVTGTIAAIRDVSNSKLAEAKLRASEASVALNEARLNRLHHIISGPELEDADRLQQLLQLGLREFGLDSGVVAEIAGGVYRVKLAATPEGPAPSGFSCDAREVICIETLRRNDLLAIDSLAQTDWRRHRAYSDFGIEVYFGVPLRVGGMIFGTLCYTSLTPRAPGPPHTLGFSSGDHEFLRLLAQTMGTEMTRQQDAGRLIAAQQRQRLAMQAGGLGTWETDTASGQRSWSPEAMAMFGLELADGIGHLGGDDDEHFSRVHPDDRHLLARYRQDLREAGSIKAEYRIVLPGGDVRWVAGGAMVLTHDPAGSPDRVIHIAADVTQRKQAQDTISRQLRELDTLYATSPIGLFQFDANLRFVRVNAWTAAINGRTVEDHVGRTVHDVLGTGAKEVAQLLRQVLETGEPMLDLEVHGSTAARPDERDWLASYYPVRDAAGEVVGVQGVVLDITERKRRERHIAFLADLQGRLPKDASAAESMAMIGKLVAEHLGVPRCTFVEIDEPASIAKVIFEHCAAGQLSLIGTYELKQFIAPEELRQLSAGRPLVINDVRNARSAAAAASFEALGVGAMAVAPYARGGVCIFNLSVHVASPRHWLPDEIEFLTLLAERVYLIIEREHSDEALRLSEEFNRTVLESSPDCVKVLDGDGRVQFMNVNGRCLMEVDDFEAMRDQPWASIWPEAEQPKVRAALARAKGGEVARFQAFAPTVKGTPKWWDVIVAPSRTGKVGDTQLVSVSRDITDQRDSERAVRESEERFRVLATAMPQLVWTCSSAGECTFQGPQWESATGQPCADALGYGWLEMIHPDDRARTAETWQKAVAEAQGYEAEYRLRTPAGTYRWFLARASRLADFPGALQQWIGTSTDIEEAKRTAILLEENETRMRLATEATAVGIWEWNVRTGAIRWDAQMFHLYGLPPTPDGLVQYTDWSTALLPEDLLETERILQDTVRRGGQSRREFRILRHTDGECRVIEAVETVRANEHGQTEWVVGTNLDITERKSAQARLQHLAADLAEADRRKDVFLATLAHELRNPLAPVRNSLELMKRANGNDVLIARARATIERQMTQMVRLIDDLLDVSRITSDKLRLSLQRTELAQIIHDAVETCVPHHERAGQTLRVVLPPVPIHLHADPARLTQVFGNLLNNASKYTPVGGSIELVAEMQGDDVVVTVRDTGIGIPADMLLRVFDLFTQVDAARDLSKGGLGIGLALAKRITEMHGGSISVRSEGRGEGSAFVVRLSAKSEPPARAPGAVTDATHAGATLPAVACRILVVDDNRDSAESLAALLALDGRETLLAHDGLDAVEKAAAFRPHIILLDIGLPIFDGYEACRRIRQQPWSADTVIVALTGWGQAEDRRKSKDAGFDSHCVKPVDHSVLMGILTRPRAGQG